MALGYVPVLLPSRGLLYGDKVPDGRVNIRKLTVGEEIILQSTGGTELVSALIQACVQLPNGFAHGDLLSSDRLALLIALRVHTFGSKYAYSYKCQSCGAANKAECDLSKDISQHTAEDSLAEPIDVRLEDEGKSVSLRFLRGKDEDAVIRMAKRTAMQSNDIGDPSMITRMALQLVKVDGQDAGDLPTRERFVRNLTMVDGADFRAALDDKEPSVDLGLTPECKACGSVNQMSLPFTLEFFRPTRR